MVRIERRLVPASSVGALVLSNGIAIVAALVLGGLLFLPYGINPLVAYGELVSQAFLNLRGFGFTLNKAAPLILVGIGVIVAWRGGFGFLGMEGCLLIGAAASSWVALFALAGKPLEGLPFALLLPLIMAASFVAGGLWSGLVGFLRARFGGSEVLVSLMMNYVAVFVVQYLVSGPMRAAGDLPQTPLLPKESWLPIFLDGTRAHAGIFIALACAVVVWLMMRGSVAGYELIATGLNPKAARYGGINVARRTLIAATVCGGFGALAGTLEILGTHHRLLDGLSQGTGFIGIVTALLGKLDVVGTVIASILYGGLTVGGDAMQRHSGLPSSVVLVIQSLIVLFILASDLLRSFRIVRVSRPRRRD